MGCEPPVERARGSRRGAPGVLEREHLLPAPARPGLFRASDGSGRDDSADLRRVQESDPGVQRRVSVDVRVVRDRHVPVRARPDRIERRGVSRGPCVRLRPVPLWHVAARAGAVVDVDAVRAARLSPLSREPSRRCLWWAHRPHGSRRTCRAATTCCFSVRLSRSTSSSRSHADGCGRTAACWRGWRWRSAAVGLGTAPFLIPYWRLRQLGFSPRSLAETIRYSADVLGVRDGRRRHVALGTQAARVAEAGRLALSRFCDFGVDRARHRPSMAAGTRRVADRADHTDEPGADGASRGRVRGHARDPRGLVAASHRRRHRSALDEPRSRSPHHRGAGGGVARHVATRAHRRLPVRGFAGRHADDRDGVRVRDVARSPDLRAWPADRREKRLFVLLRFRARVRRPARAGTLCDGRRAWTRRARGLRRRGDRSPSRRIPRHRR